MSNDMPDVIYAIDERLNEPNSLGVYSHYYNNGRTKYYSESYKDQLIKEAEQRQLDLLKLIHDDLLMRAEIDDDGIKVVDLSGFIWAKIKTILNAGGE